MSDFVNLLSRVLVQPPATQAAEIKRVGAKSTSSNPFSSSNPFIQSSTENFFAINSKASEQEQKAAEEFMYWLFSSETGKKFVNERLEFIAPFDTFSDEERPKDPLAQEVIKWMNNADVTTIPWNFTVFPSQTFKEDFGASLLQYAQGSKNWDKVKEDFTKSWKNESQ